MRQNKLGLTMEKFNKTIALSALRSGFNNADYWRSIRECLQAEEMLYLGDEEFNVFNFRTSGKLFEYLSSYYRGFELINKVRLILRLKLAQERIYQAIEEQTLITILEREL